MYTKDDLRDLTLVEGCATDHGYWMRATGPGAARVADQISGHGVGRWIESRFDERCVAQFFDEHPEGRLPEYYMLVDDPAAPTIAHVSLGAAKGDLFGVSNVMSLSLEGRAGGYRVPIDAPKEMFPPMRDLALVENLALRRHYLGDPPAESWTMSYAADGSFPTLRVRDEMGRNIITLYRDDEYDQELLETLEVGFDELADPDTVRNMLTRMGYLAEGATYFDPPSRGGPDQQPDGHPFP